MLPSASAHAAASSPYQRAERLLLIEPSGSPFFARIAQAAREMRLIVDQADRVDHPPEVAVVGIGPSVPEPLQVARDVRRLGGQVLLVFFTATTAAKDALHAELIRDPFIAERYELIEVTEDRRQLATRIRQANARVARTRHPEGQSKRRAAPRSRAHARTRANGDEYLASILAEATEAILSTDTQMTILTWNGSAERLLGIPGQSAVGKTLKWLDDQVDDADCSIASLGQQVLAAGEPEQATLTRRLARAEALTLAISLAPIRDAEGRMLGLSVIARDDSEHQRAEAALRDANRQKDEFLAIMSHELRTPLTSILGYTDMLLRGLSGPLAPRTGKYVANVRAAGDRLLDLVNGLLDFTRLEAGAERLEVQLVNLPDLVRRTAERCRAAAESKQLELQVSIDKRIGEVRADDDKLQHVLRSYLGNAIKFTPEGGSVQVDVAPDPRHDDAVRVSVSDSGIGMRDEQLARVWERFYQGDASLTRPYGGMGLGLSIARHLVLLHGGEVGAESSGPDQGSTFWFSLPRSEQPEPTPPRTTRTAPPRVETPGSQSSDRVNRSPTRR